MQVHRAQADQLQEPFVWVPCMSSQAFDRSCLVRLMEHLAPHAALLSDAGCPSVTHAAGQALQERPKFAHGMSQARRNVLHGFSLADAFVHPTNHGAVASVEPGSTGCGQPNAPLGGGKVPRADGTHRRGVDHCHCLGILYVASSTAGTRPDLHAFHLSNFTHPPPSNQLPRGTFQNCNQQRCRSINTCYRRS